MTKQKVVCYLRMDPPAHLPPFFSYSEFFFSICYGVWGHEAIQLAVTDM